MSESHNWWNDLNELTLSVGWYFEKMNLKEYQLSNWIISIVFSPLLIFHSFISNLKYIEWFAIPSRMKNKYVVCGCNTAGFFKENFRYLVWACRDLTKFHRYIFPMIIFSDSKDPIFNSRDLNQVPKTHLKTCNTDYLLLNTSLFYLRWKIYITKCLINQLWLSMFLMFTISHQV